MIEMMLPLLISWYLTTNEYVQNGLAWLFERGLPKLLYAQLSCFICLTTSSSIIYYINIMDPQEAIGYGILMGIIAKLLRNFNI